MVSLEDCCEVRRGLSVRYERMMDSAHTAMTSHVLVRLKALVVAMDSCPEVIASNVVPGYWFPLYLLPYPQHHTRRLDVLQYSQVRAICRVPHWCPSEWLSAPV